MTGTREDGGGRTGVARKVPRLPDPPPVNAALPPETDKRPSPAAEDYRRMGLAYSLPAALVAPVIVLTLLGAWLDRRTPGSSIWTMLGAALGLAVGLLNMMRLANRLDK